MLVTAVSPASALSGNGSVIGVNGLASASKGTDALSFLLQSSTPQVKQNVSYIISEGASGGGKTLGRYGSSGWLGMPIRKE